MDPYITTILDPEIKLDENATGGVQYIWYVGSDSVAQGPTTNYTFQDTGRFNIGMVVIDANGCADTVWQEIYIAPDYSLFAPNAFTPNEDGTNDVWALQNLESFPDAVVKIYNRWGDLVFKSNGYNTPWDGNHQLTNLKLPNAVYYYVIQNVDPKFVETGSLLQGYVTIIR